MIVRRFLYASHCAYNSFVIGWNNHDAWLCEAYGKRAESHDALLSLSMAKDVGEVDRRFVNSFIHNLTPESEPSLDQIERFLDVVARITSTEGRLRVLRDAMVACPKLAASKPVMRFSLKHGKTLSHTKKKVAVTVTVPAGGNAVELPAK